jgi:hypothetical protein
MAVYRYATKDLSISTAKAFKHSLESSDIEDQAVYYVVLGKNGPFVNEPTPVNPDDNEKYLHYDAFRNFIGGKKVNTNDVSHIIERHDWVSGTVYQMYRHTSEDMYERNFYVMTNEYNVYKCLYNNKESASTVKPTGYSTLPFTTSDGYTWKYMYSVSLGEANKFMTAKYIPVKNILNSDGSGESDRQYGVQQAAVNGAIEVIETDNIGSNYLLVDNGVVEAGGRLSIRMSTTTTDLSPIDNIYNGSSVYIKAGTGAGQLRRIIDYSGTTKTLTVNTAFVTTPNTDSLVVISPTVTIIGDGAGAKAYSLVNANTGAVSNVSIIDVGSGYSEAEVLITANAIHGTGATANAIISPVGGHGSDPIRELYGDKIMLNVQFGVNDGVSANGNGYIPSNTEFRSISVLKNPILKCDSNNNIVATESVANSSNSPSTLRFTSRLTISYTSTLEDRPDIEILPTDTLTTERMRLRAELGELEFVTELSPTVREAKSLSNALRGANCNVVYVREDETQNGLYTAYINNVQSYANYPPFVKDDVILKSDSEEKIATVEAIKGPEANTFSGEIVYTENVQVVERDPDQQEDIKIILDF